jgi:hypothetical protein
MVLTKSELIAALKDEIRIAIENVLRGARADEKATPIVKP